MADVASDRSRSDQQEPSSVTRQVVMHPTPCAACGQRPQQAQWVLVGEPARWTCSPACLRDVMDRELTPAR